MTIKLHYFPIVADAGETKTATFRVKLKEKKAVEATVKVLSTRGGYLEKKITLGQ